MNWKTILPALTTLCAALAGCGGDDCTRAADQIAACAPQTTMASSSSTMTMMATACDGFAQCQAGCINSASCTQINGNAPTYTACLVACQGK